MRITICLAVLGILTACSGPDSVAQQSTDTEASVIDYQKRITIEGLKKDLTIIASDEMQGRDTGSEGLRKAEDYLISKYKELGLIPVGDDGSYRQNLELSHNNIESITYTLFDTKGDVVFSGTHNSEQTTEYVNLVSTKKELSGQIVFTGTGSYSEKEGINHFNIDVQDKWMLMFFDDENGNYEKTQSLINKGALGGLLIVDPESRESYDFEAASRSGLFGRGSGRMSLPYLNRERKAEAFVRVSPEQAMVLLGLSSQEELVQLREEILANKALILFFQGIDKI